MLCPLPVTTKNNWKMPVNKIALNKLRRIILY
jgi:hypothetical protein